MNVELVCSQNEHDREEVSSDINDLMVVSFYYLHGREVRYSDSNVLLGTGSTCSVNKNHKILLNITNSKRHSGHLRMKFIKAPTRRGGSPEFFKVRYNPKSMMNILSFKDVR